MIKKPENKLRNARKTADICEKEVKGKDRIRLHDES
jgi:hypothetical protein